MMQLSMPLTKDTIQTLHAGDRVLLSGDIYTGRDAAHKRMLEFIDAGKPLPFAVRGQGIYYAGPCPAPPGRAIGSVGPTTSQRMDAYAPRLIQEGLCLMIGKGPRSESVVEAIKAYEGIYFSAIGGAGALMALCVQHAECLAFEDLGPEAIYKLTVLDMPLVVAIDCKGGSLYDR